MDQLLEEIKLLIQYAVQQDEIEPAVELVERFCDEKIILSLFHEYYSTLPEAREEPIKRLAELASRKGVFLFVVSSTNHDYLYVVSGDQVVWLADYGSEVSVEVLSFFDFQSQADFLKLCVPVQELKEYNGLEESVKDACPACGVLEGEEHFLLQSVEPINF